MNKAPMTFLSLHGQAPKYSRWHEAKATFLVSVRAEV